MTGGPELPEVVICVGGGGVGKTTTAAALALNRARAQRRTLVVTIDPARRLAHALGVPVDAELHDVPAAGAPLVSLMPESRQSAPALVSAIFVGDHNTARRVLDNPLFVTFSDAMAGMHELVCMILIADALEKIPLDTIVIDTAPSRHAVDMLRYPERLAAMLEGRALTFFAELAKRASRSSSGGWWSKLKVEAALAKVLPEQTLHDIAILFSDIASAKDRFAHLARVADRLLRGPTARYVLVGNSSTAALADMEYLDARLREHDQRSAALILNRADGTTPPWLQTLRRDQQLPPALSEQVDRLIEEAAQRAQAARTAEARLRVLNTELVRLPTVESTDPSEVVRRLSSELDDLRL